MNDKNRGDPTQHIFLPNQRLKNKSICGTSHKVFSDVVVYVREKPGQFEAKAG
jgi:hypothetical protein